MTGIESLKKVLEMMTLWSEQLKKSPLRRPSTSMKMKLALNVERMGKFFFCFHRILFLNKL